MINLIPAAAKQSLIKEYWMRAVTVWFFLWSVAVLLGIFIMVPSYVLTHSQVSAYKDSAQSATEKIANYETVSKELERSGKLAAMMKANFALPSTSAYITLFRSLERNGIEISQISMTRGEKGMEPILIAGIADDRQALATFRDTLVGQVGVTSVDLPLSNLAKDRDIPFEVTVTFDNTKNTMTKSSVRNFVIALLTLLLSLGALGFMIFEIERKTALLQEQLTSIEAQNKRESTFYTLQKKSEESKDDRLAVEKYFLRQSSDSIDFLNRVEQLAPLNGVTLETEALEEATDKKTQQKHIEAKFMFSGTQNDVEEFIEILESLPYVARITSASISEQAQVGWQAKVTMRVFILNYEI